MKQSFQVLEANFNYFMRFLEFDALYTEIEKVAKEYKSIKQEDGAAAEEIFEEVRKVGAYANETMIAGIEAQNLCKI